MMHAHGMFHAHEMFHAQGPMDMHGMLHAYGTLYVHVYGVLPVHGMLHGHATNMHIPYTWITPLLQSVASHSAVLMHSLESVYSDNICSSGLGVKALDYGS